MPKVLKLFRVHYNKARRGEANLFVENTFNTKQFKKTQWLIYEYVSTTKVLTKTTQFFTHLIEHCSIYHKKIKKTNSANKMLTVFESEKQQRRPSLKKLQRSTAQVREAIDKTTSKGKTHQLYHRHNNFIFYDSTAALWCPAILFKSDLEKFYWDCVHKQENWLQFSSVHSLL